MPVGVEAAVVVAVVAVAVGAADAVVKLLSGEDFLRVLSVDESC